MVQAFQKYAVFYTLLSVGPLLLWLFFSTATNWVFAHVFPWTLVYCLFFLMYIAMPNTFVKWHAALLGTFVAGTFFQIARIAFGRYLELVWQNYSDIYGALAMLVIFAIWTYVAWVVILLGAEVSHSIQHFHQQDVARGRFRYEGNGYLNASGVITLFLIVAARFAKGGGACLAAEVAARSGVSEEIVHQSFERFKAAGLVYEVEGDTDGYLPARALEDITLATLVDAVEGEMTTHFSQRVGFASGTRVLAALEASQQACLAEVTVAALLDE